MSETEQSASRVSVPRAVIPPFERPPLQTKRDVLADVTLVTPRERRSNLRRARLRKKEEEPYFSPERQADLISERPALARQKRNKKPGDPSRSVPLAFDELGNFVKPLAGRIPARQATQAHLLLELGLSGKARRQAWCSLVARRRDCFSGNPEHQFYSLCRCGNRYCPTCGPKSFRDLFTRHSRLRPLVDHLLEHRATDHRPRVLAKLDFTTRNTGDMPTADGVRRFNEDIRKFFRAVEKRFGVSRKDYGFLWCCEFGSGNTNLHAHGIYVGPLLPQRKRQLSKLWAEIRKDGSYIVSIKFAHSFEAALGHALKYPSKFFDASPHGSLSWRLLFSECGAFMHWPHFSIRESCENRVRKVPAKPDDAPFVAICFWTLPVGTFSTTFRARAAAMPTPFASRLDVQKSSQGRGRREPKVGKNCGEHTFGRRRHSGAMRDLAFF